nr:hypothetical protein [Myxococcales bacterium]
MHAPRSLLLLLALAACGPAQSASSSSSPWTNPGEGAVGATSGTEAERFFPLAHGYIWQYATSSDEGDKGVLLIRAHRTDALHGELRTSGGARRIEYLPEGVGLAGRAAYILKTPLAPGVTWTGEHGGRTRIVDTNMALTVPAGRFSGCIMTVEDTAEQPPFRYTTVFCPDVGITMLSVQADAAEARAELRSYGPPVNIGPDGNSFTSDP